MLLPYSEGRRAFENGKGRESNPFTYGSRQWQDWLAGWLAANTLMEG